MQLLFEQAEGGESDQIALAPNFLPNQKRFRQGRPSKPMTNQLTPAQQRAQYTDTQTTRNSKPHFIAPTKQVLSYSEEFAKKQLCSGLTINLGMGCGFQCAYCYVPGQMARHPLVNRIRKETGLKLGEISLTRESPAHVLQRELLYADGTPRFRTLEIAFTSTLIDPCANLEILAQTREACLLVLQHTPWSLRVLTKSALVPRLATELQQYKDRLIFGLSTGTFDDTTARFLERGASPPTARLAALKTLHVQGFRTFGMICPVLPQKDYNVFAREVAERVLPFVTDNMWAEVINPRGKSFTQTIEALGKAGNFSAKYGFMRVKNDKCAWEEYARATFAALANVVPASKLRFLQYVQDGTAKWWREQSVKGAVLLKPRAKELPIVAAPCPGRLPQ